ncbi:MAG: hypothetical protein GKC10_06505 [Methanosarcinales archaeon]|nr:hypothetical protein [Methanosarcinales archaeon]
MGEKRDGKKVERRGEGGTKEERKRAEAADTKKGERREGVAARHTIKFRLQLAAA